MAKRIALQTFCDSRGKLTVIEEVLPFQIKRIFFIYGVDDSIRGGHRHHKTHQAAVCIQGRCVVKTDNNVEQREFILDRPDTCVLLLPEDYHSMYDFSSDAILMVFASENYDEQDYIFEPYD